MMHCSKLAASHYE